jgi:hypothetical protein
MPLEWGKAVTSIRIGREIEGQIRKGSGGSWDRRGGYGRLLRRLRGHYKVGERLTL